MTALFKNRTMVQASSLGPNKHKRGRLRHLGGTSAIGEITEIILSPEFS